MRAELQPRAVAGARQQLAGLGSETLSFTGTASGRLVPGPTQGAALAAAAAFKYPLLCRDSSWPMLKGQQPAYFEVWHPAPHTVSKLI